MKKHLFGATLLLIFILSCEKESEFSNPNENNEQISQEVVISYDYQSGLKRDFAKALALTLEESESVRSFIKNEALKMFNKDYDILYHLVKDEVIDGEFTFRNLLLKNIDNEKLLEIEQNNPLLTIFVPKLPEDSFSAHLWNVQTEIPHVALSLNSTNDTPVFSADGTEFILKAEYAPGFPVIVVKDNERVVVNYSSSKGKPSDGLILKTAKSDYEFLFLDQAFNGMSTTDENKKTSNKIVNTVDQKLVSAYNIYKNVDGWHRDYIYYNISPSTTSGQFNYDFQEQIVSFSLSGNPEAIYTKISDQSGDPWIKKEGSISKVGWTGGFFEFKVSVLLNAKNGIGTEVEYYFGADPDDLFELQFRRLGAPNPLFPNPIRYYKLESISLKTMDVTVPIFNWDLNQYASTIRIFIEEVDLTETIKTTQSYNVKFATNFSIDASAGLLKKVGLKFGASLESNQSTTVERTVTMQSDPLGSVIINFADDVILNGSSGAWNIREYNSGSFKISLMPKRVQGF